MNKIDLKGRYCVLRGGSWGDTPVNQMVSYRDYDNLDLHDNHIGFRVCRTKEVKK